MSEPSATLTPKPKPRRPKPSLQVQPMTFGSTLLLGMDERAARQGRGQAGILSGLLSERQVLSRLPRFDGPLLMKGLRGFYRLVFGALRPINLATSR